jgi:hypothetical protein
MLAMTYFAIDMAYQRRRPRMHIVDLRSFFPDETFLVVSSTDGVKYLQKVPPRQGRREGSEKCWWKMLDLL